MAQSRTDNLQDSMRIHVQNGKSDRRRRLACGVTSASNAENAEDPEAAEKSGGSSADVVGPLGLLRLSSTNVSQGALRLGGLRVESRGRRRHGQFPRAFTDDGMASTDRPAGRRSNDSDYRRLVMR